MKNKKILLYISAFVLIYYVNFLPYINPYIIPMLVLTLLVLSEKKKENLLTMVLSKKTVLKFIFGIIISAVYYFLVYTIKNSNFSIQGTRIVQNLIFIVYFGLVLYLIRGVNHYYKTSDDKIEFLFRIAAIQGVICIAMLVIPPLKQIANNLFLANSNFSSTDYILTSRIYGISNSYTYGLPILHGLISGICFYYGTMKDKKYLKYLPFIILVSILNGRTGIIVALVAIFMVAIYVLIKAKHKLRAWLTFAIVMFLFVLSIFSLQFIAPNIYKFISVGYDEVTSVVSGNGLSGTVSYLFKDNLFLPDNTSGIIFGEGTRVYASENSVYGNTDIGFVNNIFMGGLIYCFVLYGSYIAFIHKTLKKKELIIVELIIITTLAIANWKGEIFSNATFMIGLFYILASFIPHDELFINVSERSNKNA